MKLFSILFFLFVYLFNFSFSQNFEVKTKGKNLEIKFNLEESNFDFVTINGEQYIDFSKKFKVISLEKGKPALPLFGETIAIPNKGTNSIQISYDEVVEYDNVLVAPSKGNLKRNVNPSEIPYEFGAIYSQNENFPVTNVKENDPFILRSIRGQVLTASPYQYNAVTKKLLFYKNLKITVSFQEENQGINELNTALAKSNDAREFSNLFANQIASEKYDDISEEGEILFILEESYLDSVKALIDWKHQKGIKTHVRFTSEVGTTASEIKPFLENYYLQNPNLKYLVLVGDNAQIETYSYGTSWDNEELFSDSYFGQLLGNDYYPELFVGRLSGNSSEVSTMTKRILEYEKNPSAGDWMTKASGLGSSEGAGYGDDDEADWQHLRLIRNQFLNYGYTQVHEFYDGSRGEDDAAGSPISADIKTALNDGLGLFNYTGHGDLNTCITGNFTSNHINSSTNNGKYPFVVSVACNNGTFTYGTCISETWLRATNNNSPAGAIASCGSSILMAWAPPMETQDEMANLITATTNKKTSLGALFYNSQLSMLEDYPDDGVEVMQTWILFGDPSVQFRDKVTQDLTIAHPNTVFTSSVTQTIQLSSVTEGALVSLTQDSIFLGKAIISNGVCAIPVTITNNFAPITVVGTKQNHSSYLGQIQVNYPLSVKENLKSDLTIYPNPTTDNLFISTTSIFDIQILDMNGKVVFENHENPNALFVDMSSFKSGIYSVIVITENEVFRERIIKSN